METKNPSVASPFHQFKRKACQICRDCYYKKVMPDCFERIKNATNEAEVLRILHTCRERM